MDIYFLRYQPI